MDISDKVIVMPKKKYGEDRKFAWDMLCQYLELRPVEVRVALSNIFIIMARGDYRRLL